MSESGSPEVLGEGLLPAMAPDGIATPEFIASLLVDGDDDMAAWAIGQALEEQSRSAVFDDIVRGAMQLVGSRWEHGQWTISQEHLASVALAAALARLRPTDAPEARIGPVAVLAAPEGEEHVAGLACLAQILEEGGWRVENLGANVPADDLRQFVSGRTADLVALSIGTEARRPALRRTIDVLRGGQWAGAPLTIMVGGHGIAGLDGAMAGVDHVSPTLADAEEFIMTLRPRRTSSSGGPTLAP